MSFAPRNDVQTVAVSSAMSAHDGVISYDRRPPTDARMAHLEADAWRARAVEMEKHDEAVAAQAAQIADQQIAAMKASIEQQALFQAQMQAQQSAAFDMQAQLASQALAMPPVGGYMAQAAAPMPVMGGFPQQSAPYVPGMPVQMTAAPVAPAGGFGMPVQSSPYPMY